MATQHLDPEEQEQLDKIKAFWRQWGNIITWVLIAILGSYASYNGWQFWQNRQGQASAQLFDQVKKAALSDDVDKLKRVVSDMSEQAPGAVLTQHAQLLLAKTALAKGDKEAARAALKSINTKSSDDGLKAIAALRLVTLDMDAQQWASALSVLDELDKTAPDAFKGLVADRRGDILLAKGDKTGAGVQFKAAWADLAGDNAYRQLVEVKLNALGLSVQNLAE